MMRNQSPHSPARKHAAMAALKLVRDGQKIGLGTGSTAAIFIRELGLKAEREGLVLKCYATSFSAASLAREAGLNVLDAAFEDELDLSVDGADEVDPMGNLIKGGGAAHTGEKIVHALSRAFYCIADEGKCVQELGEKFPVPVEILPASLGLARRSLLALGAQTVALRMAQKKDGPVITDNGNMILDARFSRFDPANLEAKINEIPGVLENGIFALPHCNFKGAFIGSESGVRFQERGLQA